MTSKKHVAAAAAYAFLELQNMDSARLACHADSSSTFQTKLCNMILHDTIDIQTREDANRCSSYVELVVPNYNFNEFHQHFRLTRATFETVHRFTQKHHKTPKNIQKHPKTHKKTTQKHIINKTTI
jgi:hypothetical protein